MKEIYLDNAATTYCRDEVIEAMIPYFKINFGNPGSFNTVGLRAKESLDEARNKVASLINADPFEIIFTAGGTESINLAILGVAKAKKGKHIITSKIEHHAVLHTCEALEKEGYEITYLDVNQYGQVELETLKQSIREDTILVSIMFANNEIGSINHIKDLTEICKERKVAFHTDACQAGGSIKIDVKDLGVNLLTLNGSKIYGPKQTGILYVKRGTPIKPLIHGGGQERNLRSGTENIPGIIGFTKALELSYEELEQENKRLTELRDYLIEEAIKKVPKTFLNGHPTERLPNNVNLTFLDIEGEALLLFLNEYGICASSGSACTSQTLDPSHVIISIGLPYEAAHGSIRFTLGKTTTKEDIDKLLEILPNAVKRLREISPICLTVEQVLENRK